MGTIFLTFMGICFLDLFLCELKEKAEEKKKKENKDKTQ
jgi:hypothetical protein